MFLRLSLKLILLILVCVSAGMIWQQAQLSVLALCHIDPVPEVEALVAEERYAEAAYYLDFFLEYDYVRDDPQAQALHAEIERVRNCLSYQASKLGEGLLAGTSDEGIGKTAGVITDFFVVGDIRDLAAQGTNWAQGEDVDEVVAALAGIGLVATAAAETFGDSTAMLYRIGGQTFLKTAGRASQLGTDSIKLASTYGPKGLRVLDKIGPTRFIKYSARAAKIAYKGDLFDLIARFLAMLPRWILYLLFSLGIVVWIPWRWLRRLGQSRIPGKRVIVKSGV